MAFLRGISSKSRENTKNSHSPKDQNIYKHLLLNSYAFKNSLEYLPEKTIEERRKTMKEKILEIFPELEEEKSNEEENEKIKKKEFSSVNDSNSTKEIEII